MISDDIHQVLQDYYAWARINSPDDVGYPHIDPVRRLLGSSVRSVTITDDEADYINRALCFLKKDNDKAYKIIRKVYKEGKTLRQLEKSGYGDRRVNGNLVSEGRQFVRGVLFGAGLAQESGASTF